MGVSAPQQEPEEEEEEEEQEHGDVAVGRNETSVEGSRRKRMVSGFGACDGDNGGGRESRGVGVNARPPAAAAPRHDGWRMAMAWSPAAETLLAS